MTLPNIMKQYNPNITGYSIGISDEDSPESNLNRAISGAESKVCIDCIVCLCNGWYVGSSRTDAGLD
jgi:hypothetical protein